MRTEYLRTLYELAKEDKRVYALISDNGAIVYDDFRRDFPEQYLNLGISEANMLGMAAGMANQGKIPFAYTIGAFLAYRALEFIRNDICLQRMNVKIVGTGAGEIYSALGPTHHATEDMGALRSMPRLAVITPASPKEVRAATRAAYEYDGPIYLRLGTNREPEIYEDNPEFEIGKGVTVREGEDITVIGTGTILHDVLRSADELQNRGISVRVLNIHTIKPIDVELVKRSVDETEKILTVEDHNIIGGLGTAVAEIVAEYGKGIMFRRMGLRDFSHGYGTYQEVRSANGIGYETICSAIMNMLE